MRARIQTIFQRMGGGVELLLEGGSYQFFILGNKWQLMIFMGRSGPPDPSVSAHIRV